MPSIRNIYFEKPIVNRMTQGSIINGCVADAFPGEEVFGLIITPRCDISHDGKVDSVCSKVNFPHFRLEKGTT